MGLYNSWNVIKGGFNHQSHWGKAFRNQEQPKPAYDAIIIGGGGHGLATAYYLAKEFGMTNIAVLERGTIGQGNVGRNTTIVRSNYEVPANTRFYEHGLKLWEGLSQELNYNVMFSQRGVLNLAHNPAEIDSMRRRGNFMRLSGVDSELLDIEGVRKVCPVLNFDPNSRFPILGGLIQRRAGTARHDAVAWGYARGADRLGVDIIQNCEVTGFRINNGKVEGVETQKGFIQSSRVGLAVAGYTSVLAAKAGLHNLPIESHLLQACVSEGLKPFMDCVIAFGGAGHFYMSQSDKGGLVFGGSLDLYNSYAAKGNLAMISHIADCAKFVVPAVSKVRLLRHWGGVMDMSLDGSPIISHTPIEGLYLNAGWCYGGFKATPVSGQTFAHLISQDKPHSLTESFTIERFAQGRVIDERGAGATANEH